MPMIWVYYVVFLPDGVEFSAVLSQHVEINAKAFYSERKKPTVGALKRDATRHMLLNRAYSVPQNNWRLVIYFDVNPPMPKGGVDTTPPYRFLGDNFFLVA